MQIDLSQAELKTLETSLETWAEAPARDGFGMGFMEAMMCKDKEDAAKGLKDTMNEAHLEVQRRKRQVILLRAKLIQAENKSSEHENVS